MASVDPVAIAAFLLVGCLSPVLGYAGHRLIHRHKIRCADLFLESDPLVFEGARFRKLLERQGSQLLGPGRVESIAPGRVVVVSSDDSVRIPFDSLEFKDAWPHWLGDPPPGRLPAPAEESYS